MTSPFPPGSGLTPTPAPAPAPALTTGASASPSTTLDMPSPLTALLPQIASTTSGLGLTPGSNPFLALQSASGGSFPLNLPYPPPAAAAASVRSTGTGSGSRAELGLEECLRALDEAGRMVERSLEVRAELDRGQHGVFADSSEGSARTEHLQLEYHQLITSLYLLSSTTFGGLPHLPPDTATATATADLTNWCETRAALEFARREGVRGGSKVVLDVLRQGR